MSKKICLITPGHISSNPRLVKEAMALEGAGYKIHIIFTQYVAYLVEEDFKILNAHPLWSYDVRDWTGLSPQSKYHRIVSGITQKSRTLLHKLVPNRTSAKYLINRHFSWQVKVAQKCRANLYIAHNLGALPVAYDAAKANKTLKGFDAEDFHRFESTDDLNAEEVKLVIKIEDFYIPKCDYLTAASPLIAAEYEKLYNKSFTPILNVFPLSEAPKERYSEHQASLKLFWFSQTIGKGRGLEEIISALGMIKGRSFELHLLGAASPEIKEIIANQAKEVGFFPENIFYYPPISPDKILSFASQFDIGLATETGIPFNRDICLTNKIFTYIQSGLAIIASDTSAQKLLLSSFPDSGIEYKKQDKYTLSQALSLYQDKKDRLRLTKEANYRIGQVCLNWEKESLKFLELIERHLLKR